MEKSEKQPVRPRKQRDVVGSIILIGVGAVLLLHNFKLLPPDFWQTIWHFWPVLLILLGMQQILGGSLIGDIGLMLISAVIVYVVLALILKFPLPSPLNQFDIEFPKKQWNLPSSLRQEQNLPVWLR